MNETSDAAAAFAAFEQMLHDLLTHLYDPAYMPSEEVWQALGVQAERSPTVLHARIVSAIEAMEPSADAPASARLQRYYELLSCRYIQELTQKETARRLQLSPRHLRREQQMAVQALAQRLWRPQAVTVGPAPEGDAAPGEGGRDNSDPWTTQVNEELAVLHAHDPVTQAWVEPEMARAVKVMASLLHPRGLRLTLAPPKARAGVPLAAQVHPSVLRQILITAIEDLAGQMVPPAGHSTAHPRGNGTLTLSARQQGDTVEIVLVGEPLSDASPAANATGEQPVWALLAAKSGYASFAREGMRGLIRLVFPEARPVVILVIDDNDDVVHVFQRYIEGTEYQVLPLPQLAGEPLAQVVALQPDLIVLDVLLPNFDGWELLAQLRHHPITAQTPVIICSVLHRAELAHALGAAAHLAKPVKSGEFLETLDRVWRRASAGAPPAGRSSPQ